MAKARRDYAKKHKKKSAKRNVRKNSAQKQAHPIGLWASLTLLLVVLVAGFVYIYMLDKKSASKLSRSVTTLVQNKQVKVATQKKPIINKPRFEFYSILPNSSVTTDKVSIATKRTAHHYDVQVSSTRIKKDAERLRARLILHGLDSHVTRIKTAKSVWYRVSLGPYSSRTDAESVLKKLRQNNVDGLIHRMD